jgi:hypothetical protein
MIKCYTFDSYKSDNISEKVNSFMAENNITREQIVDTRACFNDVGHIVIILFIEE